MSLAAWLLRFFAPSNHSIRKSSPSSSRTADSRIAMMPKAMNTRIVAIRSRAGQRKSTATTCICVHSPRSPIVSNPSLRLCWRSSISVKSFVDLSSSKSFSHGNRTYAFVFYGMPSPVRFLACASLRDLSFTVPIIFYPRRRLLYICRLLPPSLLAVSRLPYRGEFSNGCACFQQDPSPPRYDLSPHWNNIVPR